jgi:hypothetical protein
MSKEINKIIGNSFLEIAKSIEDKSFGPKIKIALTTLGSEHPSEVLIQGAKQAQDEMNNLEVVIIGDKVEGFECYETDCENEMHQIMEKLLEEEKIQGCVTRHYNFPVGVSTVGKVPTPSFGKETFIATTTGTASTDRTEAMFKNALYGIITAKAMGKEDPSVGILNLDSARTVERALKQLKENGYKINFASSKRSDGGVIMRGNDLLMGSADVMVTDTLTGNILMKLMSSFATGGSYEAVGSGYGPGIGFDYDKTILILSRASGTPVVKNAILYGAKLAKNNLSQKIKEEYNNLKSFGLDDILSSFKEVKKEEAEEVKMPDKEIVTESISGIDVLDLEVACKRLWIKGIYAETGMGCTGPIINVSKDNIQKSKDILKEESFI